jgi:hypothetical protein
MNHLARLAAAAAALAAAAPAAAGIYTDELSKCLVAKSSDSDRTLLVKWVFSAMSTHPAVREVGEASEALRRRLTGESARLFGRLMLDDCRAETVAAVRYDGVGAIQNSFGVLGEVAMRDLMAHPNVIRELDSMAAGIDRQRMEALMREAGAPTAPKRPGERRPATPPLQPPPAP